MAEQSLREMTEIQSLLNGTKDMNLVRGHDTKARRIYHQLYGFC